MRSSPVCSIPGAFKACAGGMLARVVERVTSSLPQWNGLARFPLGVQVEGDVVVAVGRVGMRLTQHLAPDRQRLLVMRLCLHVLSLGVQVEGHIVVAVGRLWVRLA